jgi:hypothetical protein
MIEKRFLSIRELSLYTGIAKFTLHCWIKRKWITHFRFSERIIKFDKYTIFREIIRVYKKRLYNSRIGKDSGAIGKI